MINFREYKQFSLDTQILERLQLCNNSWWNKSFNHCEYDSISLSNFNLQVPYVTSWGNMVLIFQINEQLIVAGSFVYFFYTIEFKGI